MLDSLNAIVEMLNTYLYSYVLVLALLGTGLVFTVRTAFIQFRWPDILSAFGEGITADTGVKKISPFQAFAVTTASRVGTGNIAGVALAILIGGPGAVFWMWMTALLGGALSFVESVLAQIYKKHDAAGTHYNGGPAFYMAQGMGNHFLAVAFSVMLFLVFGLGFNAVQVNTIADALKSGFNVPLLYSGIALTALSAVFAFGALPRIAKVTSYMVPIMAFLYLLFAAIVILQNIPRTGEVFFSIFSGAFKPSAFGAGTLMSTIIIGVRRGLFSNEAGMGSAPNASAAAETSHPVKQGLIQAGGVFFDTLVVCSATAFVILFSGFDLAAARIAGISGIAMMIQIFNQYFGTQGTLFLTVCIFLFAFSTVLGYFFYVVNAITFITKSALALVVMRILVLLAIFGGAVGSSSLAWNSTDFLMGIMALMNIYAMWRLYHVVEAAQKDFQAQRAAGKDPKFSKKSAPGLEDLECWDK